MVHKVPPKQPTKVTLSPSRVDSFRGCARKFFYTYISKPFIPPENRYFLIGNIAHKALETLHKENMFKPIDNWKDAMARHFRAAATSYKVENKIAEGVLTKSDMLSIKEMLKRYLTHLESGIPKVHEVEKLKKVNIEGIECWLKADRIDRLGEHHFRVIDYKSGRPASKKDERDSVQIPSYGLLIRQLLDKDAKVDGAYFYLKFLGEKAGMRNYEITEEWMDEAKQKYVEVYKELTSGKCEYKPNFHYKYCGFMCDYRKICLKDTNS